MTTNIISYSGGKGSAASVLIAYKIKLKFICLFADTLIEDEDLYRFNKDLENIINQPIIRISCEKTPWDVYIEKKFIGNSRTAHCSTVLKTDVVKKYIKENITDNNINLFLGMSYEENERLERAKKKWLPINIRSLLIENKINSNEQITNIIKKYNIKLPRLYDYGFPHNNCGGFCCKAGLSQFKTLLEVFPERYNYHMEQEELTFKSIGPTARPFLSIMKDNIKYYIRLSTFKYLIENSLIKVDSYDYGGCGCFTEK